MKSPACLLLLTLLAATAAAAPTADPSLARALRKFDSNQDGKLTGEELTQARQAHNRGGKELETDPKQIQEFMERRKADWKKQNLKWLDKNNDGKIEGPEDQQAESIWKEIAEGYSLLRKDIMKKYDINDDGDLSQQEREASRAESDRRRRDIEQKVMAKYRPPAP